MKLSEILQLEAKNKQIILHKEGLFWRAYEHSAYLFTKHIKACNLTKKFYKNVKQEVAYLGFPQNSFSKIEGICKAANLVLNKKNNQITITGLASFSVSEFLFWKNKISLTQPEGVATGPRSHYSKENEMVEKIRNFSIANKTPIECQQFIAELQNQLNGQLH